MKRLFLTLQIVLLTLSCREEFILEGEKEASGLSLFGELTPHQSVEIVLNASYRPGYQGNFDFPGEAVMLFSGSDLPLVSADMSYDSEQNSYKLQNFDFKPEESNFYEITAYIPGSAFDTIRAKTYVPKATSIADIHILNNDRIDMSDERFIHKVRLRFVISAPQDLPAYFQIIPSRIRSEFRINERGERIVTDSNESEIMEVTEVVNNRNAITQLEQKEGIYVDYSRLTDDYIEWKIKSRSPMISIKEAFHLLKIEIRTLSEDLYNYHIYLDKQIISNQTDFSYPVGYFSNVQNGKGVFGSFSRKQHILPLN